MNLQDIVPAEEIAKWERKRTSETIKHRKELIAARADVEERQVNNLLPLRHALEAARAELELKQQELRAMEEQVRLAYSALLDETGILERELQNIDKELHRTAPAVIAETIAAWERHFNELGNTILPRSITRPVPGKYNFSGGEAIMETATNSESIGRRKTALRKIIQQARYEIPLVAVNDADAKEKLDKLYEALPPVEQPRFDD